MQGPSPALPSSTPPPQTLTALEEYLNEVFEGCLVVVSHDNYFVNRVRTYALTCG